MTVRGTAFGQLGHIAVWTMCRALTARPGSCIPRSLPRSRLVNIVESFVKMSLRVQLVRLESYLRQNSSSGEGKGVPNVGLWTVLQQETAR